jgi:hypothetical protein
MQQLRLVVFVRRTMMFGGLVIAGCAGPAATVSTPSPTSTVRETAAPAATLLPTAAPSPTQLPSFVATGNMHTARAGGTATVLANGKVLIAGGMDGLGISYGILASTEIYDPTTGTFSATGSMHSARINQAAALLPDGRVLIAGGFGCTKAKYCMSNEATHLATAEIYDPTTGNFIQIASMPAPEDNAGEVTLADGRVLVFGDAGDGLLYDPALGKFEPKGSIGVTGDITATLLPDGKVFIVGQTLVPGDLAYGAELYDPATGVANSVPFTLPSSANGSQEEGWILQGGVSAAILLHDGRVLLCGGGFLETYDPATGVYASAGHMLGPGQWWPNATLLPDGDVLFEGGAFWVDLQAGPLEPPPAFAIYDPIGRAQVIDTEFQAPLNSTATLLRNGDVLITGGAMNRDGLLIPSAELFIP